MTNESLNNNTTASAQAVSLFGVKPLGESEIRAQIARMEADAGQMNGLFGEKLRTAMEIGGERARVMADYLLSSDLGVNKYNKDSAGDSVASEACEAAIAVMDEIFALPGHDITAADLLTYEDRLKMANDIMAKVIDRISELLNDAHGVNHFADSGILENLDLEGINQFANIMCYLDQIIRLIDEKVELAGFDATPADMRAEAADSAGEDGEIVWLVDLRSELRKEKFFLEMAFELVDMREMIATMVAERSDKNMPIGIPQAADPADLGMSMSDLVKAFGSLIEEELTSAMDRVRAIASGKAEMTEVEKAAVRLGVIKSEILSSALEGNSAQNRAAFEKAAAELKAAVQKSVEGKANPEINTANNTANINTANVKVANVNIVDINTANVKAANVNTVNIDAANVKAANVNIANVNTASVKAESVNVVVDDEIDLPVSAKESVNRKNAGAVETANRKASESVAVIAKSATGNDTELPISAKESIGTKESANVKAMVNKAVLDGVVPVDKPITKIISVSDGADIPVSAMEAASKKLAVKNISTESAKSANNNSANVLTGEKAAAVNKTETLAQNGFAVKAEQNVSQQHDPHNPHSQHNKHAAVNPAIAQTADSASVNSVNASSANTTLSNVSTDNTVMAAGTAETGTEAETSSDNSDSTTTSMDTANSKATAAADQADKARAALASRVDQEAVIRQLTDKMQHAIRAGAHELRVTLRPEALGEVRMSIRVHGDVIMARMQVESRQVKDIVESNLQALKDALEKQNLHVAAFSVDVGTDSDRSPRRTWREMAEEAGISVRGFREGIAAADGSDENVNDPLEGELGSDTGRRFGNNTFEYFI